MSSILTTTKTMTANGTAYYPLAEQPRTPDYERAGLGTGLGPRAANWRNPFCPGGGLAAKRTGEKRCPRAGEWYLSGGPPQAWRVPNDLSTVFHILELVLVRTTTALEEVS